MHLRCFVALVMVTIRGGLIIQYSQDREHDTSGKHAFEAALHHSNVLPLNGFSACIDLTTAYSPLTSLPLSTHGGSSRRLPHVHFNVPRALHLLATSRLVIRAESNPSPPEYVHEIVSTSSLPMNSTFSMACLVEQLEMGCDADACEPSVERVLF